MTGEQHPVALIWDEGLAAYDFGGGHPLAPVRVELAVELIRACGATELDHVREEGPVPVGEDQLGRIHSADYLAAVRRLGTEGGAALTHGIGPGDNPAFPGMHEAAAAVCGASRAAAELVWEGSVAHAFNPAGGLHHAMPDRASGFCIYNDPAVAIDYLLQQGAERVCYVDVDVHHGDGVQRIFYDDPRVLTISIHESGQYLFPGTGRSEDTGGPGAPASAANLPLHPRTPGDVWLEVFDAAIDPLVRAFRPQLLVTQLGCDTHVSDPLAHLALTLDSMEATYVRLHRLAHEVCDGRWVATGGGGYQLVSVVPRAWTLAFLEMAGQPPPAETPRSWRELVRERTGQEPPTGFTEQPATVSERTREQVRAAAEEAVDACRRLVLAQHAPEDEVGAGGA